MKVGDFIKIFPFIAFIGAFVFLFQKEWGEAVFSFVLAIFLFLMVYWKTKFVNKLPIIVLMILVILLLNKAWILAGLVLVVSIILFFFINFKVRK